MKLRIEGNSIRLRLSRSDVARFAATGLIEETTEFGSLSKFTYRMTVTENFTINSAYDTSGLHVTVPRAMAQEWATSDRVSISGEQPVGNDNTLQILIEKDFQCLHKGGDLDPDAYANPLASVQN